MKKSLLASAFFMSFCCLLTGGQIVTNASMDYMANHSETVFNSKNGLLTSATNDICQTTDGHIWLAQYVGLTKYNGREFETIKSANINNKKISFEEIKCIENDNENNLYIGTMTNGLIKYSKNSYTQIETSMGEYINDIEVVNDVIFVATSNGAYYIENDEVVELNQTREYDIQSITAIGKNIYFVDSNNFTHSIYGSTNDDLFSTHDIDELEKIKTVYTYDGLLYCGSKNGDLTIYDGTDIIKTYNVGLHAITSLIMYDDALFIGTDNGIYTLKDNTIDTIDGLNISADITNITFDYDGEMWISSSNGVSKIQNNLIENLFFRYHIDGITVNTTQYFNNELYAGTSNGLICFDEASNTIVTNDLIDSLTGVRIRDLIVYKDKLYVATYDSKDFDVVIYDGSTISEIKAWDFVDNFDTTMAKLGDIRCFYTYNDALFIGTNYGIVKYENDTFTTHILDNERRPLWLYVENDKVYSCSDGSGLIVYDMDLNKLYTLDGTDKKVILRAIELDNGILYSAGAELFYYKDNATKNIDLPNLGSISDLLLLDDRLIICTTSEIFCINKNDLLSDNLNKANRIGLSSGLQSGVTANGSSYYDSINDVYYFSCQDGVYKYDYKDTNSIERNIKVAVDVVYADSKEIDSSNIALSKTNARFVVRLSVLSFIDYEEYKVFYKLSGYDEDFHSFDYTNSQSIVYTNLAGGTYDLQFYVESLEGDKSEITTLSIKKDLKPSEYPWFYPVHIVMLCLLLLFIAYLIAMTIIRKIKRRNVELQEFTSGVLEAFAHAIDAKDKYTIGHSIRVAKYSVLIAKELKLPKNEIDNLYYIALLHDIGKIGVPDDVLNFPGKLSTEQFAYIKKHPEIGEGILHSLHTINHLCDGVLYHHEKYDGTGYPEGLQGNNIPLYGRIICCADCFDAMASRRCYRDKLDHDFIISEFERCKGHQFDPEIADITIKLIKNHSFDKIENENLVESQKEKAVMN